MEIPIGEHDYMVVLSELKVRVNHLWSFVEEVKQGIHVPPLELILPILQLWHAIHVVYGSNYLQPLTVEEFFLVKEFMSGKFIFPLAKEALVLLQKKVKKKKEKATSGHVFSA